MHVRNTQFDPNIQMNALYAAAKAEAKREAERTRKKLRNFASALSGEYSEGTDFVVNLSGDDTPQGQANRQNPSDQRKQNEEAKSESVGNPASYWA
jgi:hypothetical protein